MMNRRRFLAISAIAATVGLTRLTREKVQWNGVAMGADVSITLFGASQSHAAAALDEARGTIARMERLFSLYDPGSEISRLNADQSRELPTEFINLLQIADHAHAISGGLFDPTVQTVFAHKLKGGKNAEGQALHVGWNDVTIGKGYVAFQRSDMAITLNGIAQGFATDRVSEVLAAHGFDRALVNIGEFRAGPQRALIGVGGVNGDIIATEDIVNAAIATSSADGFRFPDGRSHILNPFNFDQPRWASASVIAASAAMADALSTAAILARDPQLAQQLVESGAARLVLLEDFAGGVIRI